MNYPADVQRCFLGRTGEDITRGDVDIRLRHAPRWFLDQVAANRRAATMSQMPTKPKAKRYIGWVAGVLCPGISKPALSPIDRERLPEQFTFGCFRSMLRQGQRSASKIDLRWGHDGEPIVQAPFDLTFRLHRHELVGLCFEARLPAGYRSEKILDSIGKDGCGVSVGFRGAKQWHVDRRGTGRLRIVDDCSVDHVALLDPAGVSDPAYAAAWAHACRSDSLRCPDDIRIDAELHAWGELKRQHGIEP